jgi:transposase
VQRFNTQGSSAIVDKRRKNGGQTALLDKTQGERLRTCILEEKPPDGGLWTGPKIAQWISDTTGKKVHPHRGWKYSQRLGLSLLVPRPRHRACATPKEQMAFKKNFPVK